MGFNNKWLNPTYGGYRSPSLPEYRQWVSMMQRCEVGGLRQLRNPTYVGCTHAPEWQSYDVYIEWARQQIGFLNRDEKGNIWQLDKDILFKGNKLYSPETCVFVPSVLNSFGILRGRDRGAHCIGARLRPNGKFESRVNLNGRATYLGCYATEIDAFNAYSQAKEHEARLLADKYYSIVDDRVINALRNYTISYND